MDIIRPDERPSARGNGNYFSGNVWLDPVAAPSGLSRVRAVRVSFEPGARTAWHTHPLGQVLYILSGVGHAQLAGEPVQILHPGATVIIKPGERHWHGAAPGHTFVHLAIQEVDANGVDAVWLEPVTDSEYQAP